jgi:predicted transcriptional regulator
MARPKSTQPTDGELEILKLLWEAGPSELGHVCIELRRHRPVATTTVATMLSVMLDKGLVKRNRGPKGYLWSAKAGRRETTRRLVEKLIDRAFDGSAGLLMAHLVESQKLSEKDRQEVLSLLARGAARSAEKSPPRSAGSFREKS